MSPGDSPWGDPPISPVLHQEDVHVWCAAIALSPEQTEPLWETLSADERERAGRFAFERDRVHYVAARAGLRMLLGRYVGVEPAALRFSYGPQGKPALCSAFAQSGLQFNVSHAHELAVYAFALGCRVGVDLEPVRAVPDMEQIAERVFSRREIEEFGGLAPSQRQAGFLNGWTRKEAYVKALGGGLSIPLDRFDVTLSPGAPCRLLCVAGSPQEAARWSLIAFAPERGYVAALCVEGHDRHPSYWRHSWR